MAHELEVDDILIPRPQHQPRRRRAVPPTPPKQKSKGPGGFIKFMAGAFLVLAVLVVVLSLADIGGSAILSMAQKYLDENYKISLNAEKMTGNPIKGYTLHNFEIAIPDGRQADGNNNNQKILSAGFLSGRINFPALLKGKIRLAEIALGGMDMDVDNLLKTVERLKDKFTFTPHPSPLTPNSPFITAAYAEDENENKNAMPEIPLDRFSLKDSKFSSKYGVVEVNEIGADLINFNIDVDGNINGLPVKGDIDMGEEAGFTAVNRSEFNLGSGKILATGGLINNKLDLHASLENLDLSEMTALYPEMLNANDFSGKMNFNADVLGTVEAPKISGNFDYKGSKIYGFPVEHASANIAYSDNRFAVNNIQANALNIPIQGEIAVANRPNEITSVMIKLDGTEANLDGLDKILKIPELKTLSGKVSAFNANISGPVNALNGLVNFNAPKISYEGKAVTNIKAQLKLANSDTANVNGKFNFEGANGFLQGTIASMLIKPNFNLTAKLANLDVKKIEYMIPDARDYKLSGIITAEATLKGNASNPSVKGSLTSPAFSGFDQKITKPVINFEFANKTLTLSKTEGTLNGMPINLSGTVGPLPSSNPNLNINATIAMSPANLKAYVPDIDSYALKGTINAGLKIQGSVNNPSIKLLASSQNLQAMNMITARDIELTTTAGGDLTKLEKINVNASAKSIIAGGVTFNGVNAAVNKNGDKISLDTLKASSGAGTITGTGTASASGKEPLNFNFNFNKLALASLAAASGVDVKGELSGSLKIAGANDNPEIFFNAGIPSLNAMGFALNNIVADLSGNSKNLKFNKVTADFEGSELVALGNIQFSPLKYNVALSGNNIKLENLLREMPDMKDKLSGTAGLTFNLTGNEKGATGKGSLTSQAIRAFGLNLTKINVPLSYSGNSFASNNATANFYGGTAKNTLNFDIKNMKFTDNVEASGIDVNALIQDAAGGLEGKITGAGKFSMKINGAVKDAVSYSGTGNFSMGEGAISGFKWLDLITKIHGTNGIKYASVNAPLALQTGKLLIKSGSIAKAFNNDPIYTYAKLIQDGVVNFSGKEPTIDFMTESNINYQLINAIQGGSKGGLDALFKGGASTLQDGLKAFLTGGMAGAEKVASTGDFRIVNLKISGKAASPSFSGLKIGPSTLKKEEQVQTADKKDTQKENFQEKIINRAVDVILPTNNNDAKKKLEEAIKKNIPSVAPKTQTQTSGTQAKPSTPTQKKNVKDAIKEGVQNALKDPKNQERLKQELQKGLGGLFR